MLHKGTAITRGTGTGVVVATGMATELGLTARLVLEAEADISPLERKLSELTKQLVKATLIVTALIAAAGMATGRDLVLMIEAGIALAVAAIPEGLPIVTTMALARGMWRMARRNVVVERLAAVETLGATTVICTDKTGTLTENRMTVERISLPSGDYRVDHKKGWILDASGNKAELGPPLRRSLEVGVLCGTATLKGGKKSDAGDPIELALLRVGQLANIDREALLITWPERHQIAFDTGTKMMATAHDRDRHLLVAVKGAPEAVLAVSTSIAEGAKAGLSTEEREEWLHQAAALAEDGLRVLALAEKTIPAKKLPRYEELTFLGLVGFRDPPRIEVKQAIADCRQAGIRVVMVTGDHAVTARKIAVLRQRRQRQQTLLDPFVKRHVGDAGRRREQMRDGFGEIADSVVALFEQPHGNARSIRREGAQLRRGDRLAGALAAEEEHGPGGIGGRGTRKVVAQRRGLFQRRVRAVEARVQRGKGPHCTGPSTASVSSGDVSPPSCSPSNRVSSARAS